MEVSKFFNSAPGDPRTYQASDFADYFGKVLSTGLLHTDNVPAMEVKCEGTDLRTFVEPGKAIMQGYGYENTSDLYLTHALPEATLDRIDRIVLRLDKRNQSRFIKLFVKQGEALANPVPPALQRDEFIYELSLAQIRVRANTSTLLPADLVDERLDENLCGIVHSLISIPTSQFQTEWDAFMADIQDSGFATQTEFNEHRADYVKHPGAAKSTNTGNSYAVTLNPAPTAYVDMMGITVTVNADSTGAATLNVNGLGAKAMKKANGYDATNLKANGVYTFRYNATTGNFILQGEGGSGNLQPNQALAGFTFTNDEGEQVGEGDPDLIAENIRQGIEIFGVAGAAGLGRKANGITSHDGAISGSIFLINNLTFKPSKVIVAIKGINSAYAWRKTHVFSSTSDLIELQSGLDNDNVYADSTNENNSGYTDKTTTRPTIQNNGFTYNLGGTNRNAQVLRWWAFE